MHHIISIYNPHSHKNGQIGKYMQFWFKMVKVKSLAQGTCQSKLESVFPIDILHPFYHCCLFYPYLPIIYPFLPFLTHLTIFKILESQNAFCSWEKCLLLSVTFYAGTYGILLVALKLLLQKKYHLFKNTLVSWHLDLYSSSKFEPLDCPRLSQTYL